MHSLGTGIKNWNWEQPLQVAYGKNKLSSVNKGERLEILSTPLLSSSIPCYLPPAFNMLWTNHEIPQPARFLRML